MAWGSRNKLWKNNGKTISNHIQRGEGFMFRMAGSLLQTRRSPRFLGWGCVGRIVWGLVDVIRHAWIVVVHDIVCVWLVFCWWCGCGCRWRCAWYRSSSSRKQWDEMMPCSSSAEKVAHANVVWKVGVMFKVWAELIKDKSVDVVLREVGCKGRGSVLFGKFWSEV